MHLVPGSSLLGQQAPAANHADDRGVVAREFVLAEQVANFHFDEVQQFGIVHGSTLFRKTTMAGTPTWRASRMCSRVWGIGPSTALTTRIAPSIWAAPVIMFLT
jgi:hypothetical protein